MFRILNFYLVLKRKRRWRSAARNLGYGTRGPVQVGLHSTKFDKSPHQATTILVVCDCRLIRLTVRQVRAAHSCKGVSTAY